MAKLYYNGHGSFRLITSLNTVVYIDPYAGEGYEEPADIILVTHQHGDHNQIDKPTKKSEYQVIMNSDSLINGEYKEFKIKDIDIKAVPAHNKNHSKEECVGYLVKTDGVLIYFSGDTSKIVEMNDLKSLNIDYAFFSCDGVYNMDEVEAAECAKIVSAIHSIPVHLKPGALYDKEKANNFKAEGKLLIEPGEEIHTYSVEAEKKDSLKS